MCPLSEAHLSAFYHRVFVYIYNVLRIGASLFSSSLVMLYVCVSLHPGMSVLVIFLLQHLVFTSHSGITAVVTTGRRVDCTKVNYVFTLACLTRHSINRLRSASSHTPRRL